MTKAAAAQDIRPEFKKFRFDEDYSFLNSSGNQTSAFDSVKYIPLSTSNDHYLSVGGSVRERYEYTGNPTFGMDPQTKNGVWLQRVNVHADVHFGPSLRVFGQVSSALAEGRAGGPSPVDENKLDVQNGFADVLIEFGVNTAVTLRGGRQELEFGSGRLVDVREGPNVRRTFDGFRGILDVPGWKLNTVLARPRRDNDGVFDDETNDDIAFWGVYAVAEPSAFPAGHLDLYYLGIRDDAASFVQGAGREKRHSIGARLWGDAEHWDWNWEAVYQFGSFGNGDIAAWTLASDTGFTFAEAAFRPRIALRANIASGDKDAGDTDLQTFNPLFPRGNYFSQAAVLGPRNFFNLNPHLNLQLSDALSINTNINFFWRLETNDGVYGPAGQIIRAPANSDARYVATGLSIEATWTITNHFDVTGIFSRLEPGDFIRETGEDKRINFFELTVRFRI